MKKDILHNIIAQKQIELTQQKASVPESALEEMLDGRPADGRSMKKALAESRVGIIAEFKRKSPSKALSVLTDEPFFGGTLKDLANIRKAVEVPVLRKDFIISRYQLLQAKLTGADAVLLIAAALSPKDCFLLAQEAHNLNLEVLLELHSEEELGHYNEYVDMVGINNRNLGTFHTDVENSFRMAGKLPKDAVRVSESGISSPETIHKLREAGYQGFLIGETFMKTPDPGKALSDFIKRLDL